MYNGGDAPPQYPPPRYLAPPGATKASPNQSGQPMEMAPYGAPMGQGPQQSGVVGGSNGDVEQGGSQAMPPRAPQKAKAVLKGFTERFRK